MPLYLISYDLRKQRNYDELYKLLELWKARRLLKSVWLAELRGLSDAVIGYLRGAIDAGDGLAVIELKKTGDWSAIQAETDGITWLETKLNP
jgi:hypothetical protein